MEKTCHRRSASAEAFAAYLLPHLLFVENFAERRMSAAMCWLAWNLSQIYDIDQRERKLMGVCKLFLVNDTRCAPTEVELTVQNQIRELIASKQNLFPHITGTITRVKLETEEGVDMLCVQSHALADVIELVTVPDPSTMSDTIAALSYINKVTAWQRDQLQHHRQASPMDDIEATRRASAYFLQRADLIAFRAILTAWRDSASDTATKAGLRYWIEIIDDIRANTEVVLSMLARQEIRDINLIEP